MTDSVEITVTPGPYVVVETTAGPSITLETTPTYSVTISTPGPQGEKGDPGEPSWSHVVTAIAAETIYGHRAVRITNGRAYLVSSTNTIHAGQAVGISTGAATIGNSVMIQISGELVEPSWAFSPGRVWVGLSGLLTQTPPSSGFQQVIARAIDATRIVINPETPIIIGA